MKTFEKSFPLRKAFSSVLCSYYDVKMPPVLIKQTSTLVSLAADTSYSLQLLLLLCLQQLLPAFVATKGTLIGYVLLRPAENNLEQSFSRWISKISLLKFQRSSFVWKVITELEELKNVRRETQRRIMFLRSSVRLHVVTRSSLAYDFKNPLHMF